MSEAVRDAVDKACKIVSGTPITITPNEKTPNIPGHLCYTVEISDIDYCVGARNAFELLQEAKEAKDYWEALQGLEAKERADAVRLEASVEVDEDGTLERDEKMVCVDGLDEDVKELLLYLIEHLTIKDASEILDRDYASNVVWSELCFLRKKLKEGIAHTERKQ